MTLDQSEIDSLFKDFNFDPAGSEEIPGSESAPDPNPKSDPLTEAISEPDGEGPATLDQSAIDALFQNSPPEDPPAPESSPPPNSDSSTVESNTPEPDVAVSLDQDELDQLFQDYTFDSDQEVAVDGDGPSDGEDGISPESPPGATAVPPATEATIDSQNDHPNDFDDMGDSNSGAGSLDQSAIDKLFNDVDLSDATGEEIEAVGSEEPETATPLSPDNELATPSDPPSASTAPKVPQEELLDLNALNSLFTDFGYEEVAVDLEDPLPLDPLDPDGVIKAELPASTITDPPPLRQVRRWRKLKRLMRGR